MRIAIVGSRPEVDPRKPATVTRERTIRDRTRRDAIARFVATLPDDTEAVSGAAEGAGDECNDCFAREQKREGSS